MLCPGRRCSHDSALRSRMVTLSTVADSKPARPSAFFNQLMQKAQRKISAITKSEIQPPLSTDCFNECMVMIAVDMSALETQMTKVTLIAVSLVMAGCALPQYETRLAPLVSNPSAPQSQAVAICAPEAQLASANARANAQANIDNRNNRVTGYDCNTQGYASNQSYRSNTSCTPTTAVDYRGPAGAMYDAQDVNNAGNRVGAAVLQSCLARLGWRTEQYCVKNCKR